MDGRNAIGAKISLLNEPISDAGPPRVASYLPFRYSRTSSYASSPNSNPPTPQLYRSDSSDSSRTMNRTPSPTTPSFIDYAGLQPGAGVGDAKNVVDPSFFVQDPSYPPTIPQPHAQYSSFLAPPTLAPQPQGQHQGLQGLPQPLGTQPLSQTLAQTHGQTQGSASLSDGASSTSKGPAKQQTKKNSYPCPLAKQFNCSDHFTTSGHAARHAKKHTGKKDAFCPECNKAFTRKDNMEQHRRTHQNGRNATKGGESAAKRQKTSKRASTASSTTAADLAALQTAQMVPVSMGAPSMLDPSLPQSPASSFDFPEPSFASNMNPAQMHSYPESLLQFSTPFVPTSPTMVLDPALGQVGNGMSSLDTLAMAAAKRDSDY